MCNQSAAFSRSEMSASSLLIFRIRSFTRSAVFGFSELCWAMDPLPTRTPQPAKSPSDWISMIRQRLSPLLASLLRSLPDAKLA